MSFRLDTGTIYRSEKTSEGFLRVWANFSKVGPLRYLRSDGSIQIEHVTEDALFDDESLQTAALKPVTLRHPTTGMVTPENARELQRGFSGNTIVKNYPYATIVSTVTDAEAIASVESGKTTQISAGYHCNVKRRTDGALEQCDRRYNHFALVEQGRAGADVCLHMDSDDVAVSVLDEDGNASVNDEGRTDMTLIAFPSGRVLEVEDEELAEEVLGLLAHKCSSCEDDDMEPWKALGYDSADAAVNDLKTKLDAAEAEKTELKTKFDQAEAGKTVLQSRADELSTQLTNCQNSRSDAAQISTEVTSRLDAWELVLPVMRMDTPDYKPDYNLDTTEIRKLAIAKKCSHVNLDGKSPEYVAAAWEMLEPALKKDATQRTDSTLDFHSQIQQVQREDGGGMMAIAEAKKRRMDRIKANGSGKKA